MAVGALPELNDRYVVDQNLVEDFQINGHVLLRGLAAAGEVATYRDLITRVALDNSDETRPIGERDTYGKAFLQVMNLWRRNADVAHFSHAARFAGVAADLLGVERVRIYHDQALFKEPSGGFTPWHQDAVYWPIDGTRCVTMWMPLVDITPEMGGMAFASGTNHAGALGEAVISDESEDFFESLVTTRGLAVQAPTAMAAGDATFHGGWTLHNAQRNVSIAIREVMTVIFFADGLVVQEPVNDAQRSDLRTWLPGLRPGDLAASELNPLLPQPA